MNAGDTIIAISSAAGQSARMIVRLSGPDAHALAARMSPGHAPVAAVARRCRLAFAGLSCPAWLYSFVAPRSYTGEHLVEFHIPGNPLLARMLMDELVWAGARPADAGEFTARAYFNGRMDLTAAEGVAAVVSASNDAELAAARKLANGQLAARIRPIMESVAQLLALVEAGIDFSDEDISFVAAEHVELEIRKQIEMLNDLTEQSARLEPLSHEPAFALVGRPNAGKSTLLNALAGAERAIVSPMAGTTRDVLRAEVVTPRGMVHVLDAAGLGDHEIPADPRLAEVAAAMRHRAMAAVSQADFVILVRDATDARPRLELSRAADLDVVTKIDLIDRPGALPPNSIAVSAVTRTGLDRLAAAMGDLAFGRQSASELALTSRHLQAIESARQSLDQTRTAVAAGVELVALELRTSLDALGGIVGQITPDDVLGRVFATFCIGK